MIVAWPLTTSTEIAQVLRPGGHLRPDSALRTLRDRNLAAEPISVVPRSGRGARGRVVWYSSLMLDVARLTRTGNKKQAVAAHEHATRLASHRSARFIAEWLVEHGGPEPDAAEIDDGTGGALTRLATLTTSTRRDLLELAGVRTFAGRVRVDEGQFALVVNEDGESLAVPVPQESSQRWSGALVVVDIEDLDGGATTLWVRPGFDPDADPNARVPGGPHILTPAERSRLTESSRASV